jgi:hypothetical protein
MKTIRLSNNYIIKENTEKITLIDNQDNMACIVVASIIGSLTYFSIFPLYLGIIVTIILILLLASRSETIIYLNKNTIEKNHCYFNFKLFNYFKLEDLSSLKFIASNVKTGGDDLGPGSTVFIIEIHSKIFQKEYLMQASKKSDVLLLKKVIEKFIPFELNP